MKKYLTEDFFGFFKKLAANNHRDWFEANRRVYETMVKKPFENLVDALIFELAKTDKKFTGIQAKDCIFRINRDVRFSKDKTPYKLNRSAIIAPGGKKDMHPVGFYFELGPEECAFYAGVYMPDNEMLANIRKYIAKNPTEFQKIIADPEFKKKFGEVQGEQQKRLDAGLKTAAAAQPLLYNKQFYIQHTFSEKKALTPGIVDYLLKVRDVSKAFGMFMDKAIQSNNEK